MFLLNSRLTRFSASGLGSGCIAFTYYRHPFSRSYGVILPSSLTVNHSSILGFSPHLPVSDYGTVTLCPTHGAFLGSVRHLPLAGPEGPFGIGARLPGRICLPGNAYHLTSAQPPSDGKLAPASPLGIERPQRGTGMLTRFPSSTPLGLDLGTD